MIMVMWMVVIVYINGDDNDDNDVNSKQEFSLYGFYSILKRNRIYY